MSGNLVRQQIINKIEKGNLVENADITHCVSPASYELRVGSYRERHIDRRIDLSVGEQIAIPPNGFILIGTIERVNIPLDIIGMMYLRSTYARRGFLSWFQGIVDPGYSGGLTIVLHNLTGELIPLSGGERICHLVFETLPEPVDQGYEGAYQGSEGATPPANPPMRIVGKMSETPGVYNPELSKLLLEALQKNPEEFLRRLLY